jgi:Na+-transporting NADH:ubiquinone oxidoreductase subunit NqrC
MHHRFFQTTCRYLMVTLLALSTLACSTLTAQPRFVVSKDQLQQALAKRFPLRYPVAGLLNLGVQASEIRLLPEQNRLNAIMAVEASGVALNASRRARLKWNLLCVTK